MKYLGLFLLSFTIGYVLCKRVGKTIDVISDCFLYTSYEAQNECRVSKVKMEPMP